MRVFWYNGGLHIEPESKSETDLLSRVVKSLRFEEPPESSTGAGGPVVLGGQNMLELLVGNKQSVECGLRRDQHINKQTVIPINKAK